MRTIALVLAAMLLTLGASACGGSGGGGSTGGTTTQVAISITGSAPKGASVTFGNDSNTYTGHFPFHMSLPLFSRAGYYFAAVRLENGGNAVCKLTIGSASRVSHADSGHKVCFVKLTNDYGGGWH